MKFFLALLLIAACVFVGWMAPNIEVALSDEAPQPVVAPSPLVVKGPESCDIGELVRIDATASQCESLVWRIIPESKDFEAVDGTKRAMFSSRVPGTFLVVVAGAIDDKPHMNIHTITVVGTVPQPNTPAALKPIDQQIVTWFALVKTEQRKEEAKKLAGVFRTLSSTDLEVGKILEATAAANRNTLGKSIDGWVPFLDALGKELDLYIANKQLGTKEQYRELWVKIAEGLEKAAQ